MRGVPCCAAWKVEVSAAAPAGDAPRMHKELAYSVTFLFSTTIQVCSLHHAQPCAQVALTLGLH